MIEEDANNVDGERKKKRRKNLCRKMCVCHSSFRVKAVLLKSSQNSQKNVEMSLLIYD